VAKDPYKYFRIEARELVAGLGAGALELGRGEDPREAIARMLRLAHTLKGAARVVKLVDAAERAHAIEEVLSRHRQSTAAVPKGDVDAILTALDAVSMRLGELEAPAAAASPAAPAKRMRDADFETVRVEREEVDRLLFALTEAAVQLNTIRRHFGDLERARQLAGAAGGAELVALLGRIERSVAGGLEQVSGELEQVRDAANKLRLVPASAIFGALERATRDAAETLDRTVSFQAEGGEFRLDAHVLSTIANALMHVVRNAVAHGATPTDARIAAGKSPIATIKVTVRRRGNVVAFTCTDDGSGVDVGRVRSEALARQWIDETEARALTVSGACSLLLRGGLSTARTVSGVAGRGVGLDVVREITAGLRGEVRLTSDASGTTLEIAVPVTLSSLLALVVEVSGATVAVPLEAIERARSVAPGEIIRSGTRQLLAVDDEMIPLVDLGRVLGRSSVDRDGDRARSVIVVRGGDRRAALAVDRLLGTSTEVALALPPHAEIDAIVAAASLDTEGVPRPILDPEGLVAAALRLEAAVPVAAAAPPARVLVIDDSLTTRMLEQAILESAGYEVDLATSAEEGIAKARQQHYGVFVVDVEMPGMDGFEFVTTTRADPELRTTPAILVTSRAAPEDLRRGRDAGASAYIVKGEFDQGTLLTTMRSLLKPDAS
jgi:two-component system chemotaxis sensor kinase CheA